MGPLAQHSIDQKNARSADVERTDLRISWSVSSDFERGQYTYRIELNRFESDTRDDVEVHLVRGVVAVHGVT